MSKEAIHRAKPHQQAAVMTNAFTQKNDLKENKEPKKNSYINLQSKLSVGAPDDHYEKEADTVADKVMRMPDQSFLQRKCANCEKDEKLQRKPLTEGITPFIQTKSESSSPAVSDNTAQSIQSSKGAGNAMDEGTASFMSSRFGADFNNVKIHANNEAAQLNRDLNAKAFTVGSDIYFNDGQYQPSSSSGKTLLAHELTHVVQQGNSPGKQIQRDGFTPWPGQAGTDVDGTVKKDGDTASGDVAREGNPEYASESPLYIEFDQKSCVIKSIKQLVFSRPKDETRLSDEDYQTLVARILAISNTYFDGWFEIHSEGKNCDICNGKPIAIDVVATHDPSADQKEEDNMLTDEAAGGIHSQTISLHAEGGRSNSGDFYAKDSWRGLTDTILTHESGHIMLNLPDEYPGFAGVDNQPYDKAIVDDHSIMAFYSARLGVMHKRHYSFLVDWLNRRFPQCKFELVEMKRPLVLEIRPTLGFSGITLKDEIPTTSFDVGVNFGIPLTSDRKWQLLVGPKLQIVDLGKGRSYMLGTKAELGFLTSIFDFPIELGLGGEAGIVTGREPGSFAQADLSLNLPNFMGNPVNFGLTVSEGVLENALQQREYKSFSIDISRSF